MTSFRSAIFLGVSITVISYLYNHCTQLPPVMSGSSSFEFRPVAHTYKGLLQSGLEQGSSFVVYHADNNVVNFRGGYTDLRFLLPWSSETVTQSFTLSLLSVPFTFALLRERLLINLTDPLAKYIPSFSVPDITVSDLLTHQSGFPYFLDFVSLTQWGENYRAVLKNITHQVPSVAPKKRVMHLHSLALLADAIVRKVDARERSLGHYFLEEVVWPLGIDILLGIPRSQHYRAARTYHADWFSVLQALVRFDFRYLWTNLRSNPWMPYGGSREKTVNLFSDYKLLLNWHPDLLELPLASSNMFTNARGLARLFQLLLPHARHGCPLHQDNNSDTNQKCYNFNNETVNWMLSAHDSTAFEDPVLRRPLALTASGLMMSTSPEGNPIFGMWDDIMGQMVFLDPARRLTVAYMTNHAHGRSLSQDPIISSLVQSVYSCLTNPGAV
ncbi:hypothetical protein T265_04496 [Opisthorchis viverrini]|uniref:Beta-lactamase-related domain-containing protein n=2 Tax=Opisthorchis viverrini TaxID=6198 RepID=A0A074ZSB5_OPIVI|nr:hypothetical protein T265_04496 [Opisthorchis viverrini]KER28707.1 hypothetical protein T265_04496 [Opisthorchis viverrini]